MWNSSDLEVPLSDFIRLFKLNEKELRAEGTSGRIVARGIRQGPNSYTHISFLESSVRQWLLRPDLPPRVARKVAKAGGLDRLEAWRTDYFAKVKFDGDDLILPNGLRVIDVQVSERKEQ